MSDNKNSNLPINLQVIPPSVDKAFQNLTDAPTQAIGKTITDLWRVVFGTITYWAEKKELKHDYCLKKLRKELESSINDIPPSKRIAPSIQITAQALENSKYCLESEELRKMFVNLISKSVNADFAAIVHPSFSEIIRQMSPYDAKILKYYIEIKPKRLITYTFSNGIANFNRIAYTFDAYPNPDEAAQISLSLSSLMRLGIIAFHDDTTCYPIDDSPFLSSDFYKCCEKERIAEGLYSESYITGKQCVLTPYGQVFVQICVL